MPCFSENAIFKKTKSCQKWKNWIINNVTFRHECHFNSGKPPVNPTWCYATWSSFTFWQMRMGWGGVGIIPNMSRARLHDLHLHLMLRYMIFTCTWCYATWPSLALDATLHDLRLHLPWIKAQPQTLKTDWAEKGPLPEWHDQKQSSFLIFTRRIFDT